MHWLRRLMGDRPVVTRDQDSIRDTSRLRIELRRVRERTDQKGSRVDDLFDRAIRTAKRGEDS